MTWTRLWPKNELNKEPPPNSTGGGTISKAIDAYKKSVEAAKSGDQDGTKASDNLATAQAKSMKKGGAASGDAGNSGEAQGGATDSTTSGAAGN